MHEAERLAVEMFNETLLIHVAAQLGWISTAALDSHYQDLAPNTIKRRELFAQGAPLLFLFHGEKKWKMTKNSNQGVLP